MVSYHYFFFFVFQTNFLEASMRSDIFAEIRNLAHFGSPDLPFYHHKKWLPVKQSRFRNQPGIAYVYNYIIYQL